VYADIAKGHVKDKADSLMKIMKLFKSCLYLWHALQMNAVPGKVKYFMKRENQLDAIQWFIELMIRSTCFGHY